MRDRVTVRLAAGLAAVLMTGVTACGREPRRGDPEPAPSGAAATHSVTVDGRERQSRAYTPAGGSEGRPGSPTAR